MTDPQSTPAHDGTRPAPPAYAPRYGAASPLEATPGVPPPLPHGYGPVPRTNGLAIASMVLSILGVIGVLPLVGSVAGTIMGHISLRQVVRSGEDGHAMALAGVIVGWVGIGMVLLAVIVIAGVLVFTTAATPSTGYA
ncbi:MAG: DUF4190 domain-containing protein [Microbacterium sp.]